jgi:hypothetical protein
VDKKNLNNPEVVSQVLSDAGFVQQKHSHSISLSDE